MAHHETGSLNNLTDNNLNVVFNVYRFLYMALDKKSTTPNHAEKFRNWQSILDFINTLLDTCCSKNESNNIFHEALITVISYITMCNW